VRRRGGRFRKVTSRCVLDSFFFLPIPPPRPNPPSHTYTQAALNRSDMFDFLIDIVPRLTGNVHSESTADASDSAADISGASEDPNDIPTISPHHASSMMMQAMARKVQQEQIAASVDPALYAMMHGFGGGPVQNVSDGTQGGDDDVQRVLADQWQKQATEMIKKVEEEKKQKVRSMRGGGGKGGKGGNRKKPQAALSRPKSNTHLSIVAPLVQEIEKEREKEREGEGS
jgi:hypothetical protein